MNTTKNTRPSCLLLLCQCAYVTIVNHLSAIRFDDDCAGAALLFCISLMESVPAGANVFVCLFVFVALGNYSSPHVMFVVVVVCVARHVMHSHY